MKESALQYIIDLASLGWTIELSKEPFNLTIKVTKDSITKESWLPYSDHCDEKNVTRCIAFMVDEIQQTPKPH